MTTAIKTYHRPDGVVGCGFYGEFGGLWQHSISWPDQSATRMRFEDLEDRKITVKDLAVFEPLPGNGLIGDTDRESGESYTVETAVDVKTGEIVSSEVMPPVNADQESESDNVPGSVDNETGEVTKSEITPVDPPAPEDANPFDASKSEAENIRAAIVLMPGETNKGIIEVLNRYGVNVSSSQVTRERKAIAKAAGTTEETAGE